MKIWDPKIPLDAGAHTVLLKRGEFTDENRQNDDGSVRAVPFKLYYPSTYSGAPLPVIFWSHGFGGSRDGAGFLSRYLASHGYVIVHLTHSGTDSSLWEGQPGHPWDVLRKVEISRQTTINRFQDVPFALDEMQNWAEKNPDVGKMMDFSRLGMSGHSFGAMTTQVIAGQLFPHKDGSLHSYADLRFKAGIVYSPVPIAHLTDAPHEQVYSSIDIPLLHMTGTEDSSPLEGYGFDHRLVIFDHTDKAEKHLLIKQGGDHMVYNGTRGKLKDNGLRNRHEEIIRVNALAYWDALLKDDKTARQWLTEGGIGSYLGEDASYKVENND